MVRKLLRSVREYKKHSILAPVFVIFEVIMEVVIPLLMANLIDFGIDDGNLEYIVKMGVVLVVFALILDFWYTFGTKCSYSISWFCEKSS